MDSAILSSIKKLLLFVTAVVAIVMTLNITGLMAPITKQLDSLAFDIGNFHLSLLSLVQGLIILVIVLWVARLTANTLEAYLRRSPYLSYNARELTAKFFRIFVYFIALMIALSAIGVDLTAFAVFGGALGVGIGLGLQKITSNFVSGITLLMEKSIKLGDLVEVGNVSGWVRQLNVRYTLIETFDGREVMIPNEDLASTRVSSWTHSHNMARVEVPVGVAYGSDLRLVQKLMVEAAEEHPKCVKSQETRCWLREFGDSSVNFLLVFWVSDVREGRFGPKSDVMFAIFDKFKQHGIEIPFPQRVVTMKGNAA